MNHVFVLFVNNHGFVGENDNIVLDIMDAQYFDSREAAEEHRIELYVNERDEFFHELGLARLWHAEQLKLHPEKHAITTKEPFRCYHVTECACGFKEACDSSG